MSDYKQPEFYRFNRDSLLLVRRILESGISGDKILDLGAGCGVIGIELAIHLKPALLTSLELQKDFLPFIQTNSEYFIPSINHSIASESFAAWNPDTEYDLIVCNPPYYLPDSGQPSSDMRRGMARTFLIDGWPSLLACIERSLSQEGRALVVVKNEKKIIELVREEVTKTKLKAKEEIVLDLIILELMRLNID